MPGTKASQDAVVTGTVSVLVLKANSRRLGAVLTNDSDTIIYLSLGVNPAVINRGIRLNAAGGGYEIALNNPWDGEVYAVSLVNTKNLCFVETE